MADSRSDFMTRLRRLDRRHRAMGRGYTATMRGDGLIVVRPRRLQFRLPIRGFILLMIIFMCFKGFMIASLGEQAYGERLNILKEGSAYEKVGAFIMGVDPVSKGISDILRPFTS